MLVLILLCLLVYYLHNVLQSKAQRVFSPKEKSAVAVSATHRKSMGKLLFMSPTLVQINLRTQEPYRFKIESFWRAAQKLVCLRPARQIIETTLPPPSAGSFAILILHLIGGNDQPLPSLSKAHRTNEFSSI